MSERAEITGLEAQNPVSFSDFTPAQQMEYRATLERVRNNLLQLARLLLLSRQLPSTIQVTVENPNCFSLAVFYYGDITKWRTVMEASGLSTPILSGPYLIKIPREVGYNK